MRKSASMSSPQGRWMVSRTSRVSTRRKPSAASGVGGLSRGLGDINADQRAAFARFLNGAQHREGIDPLAAACVEHNGVVRRGLRRRIGDGSDEAVIIALIQKVAPRADHELIVPVAALRTVEQKVYITALCDIEAVALRADAGPCALGKRPGADGTAQPHHPRSPICCGSSPRPSARSCCWFSSASASAMAILRTMFFIVVSKSVPSR